MKSVRLLQLLVAAIVTAAALAPVVALAATHEPMRHHITLAFGFGQHLSDDFDDTDLDMAGMGQFAYRYSLNRSVDLSIDGRSIMASDEAQIGIGGTFYEAELEHETSYFGPGVRWSSGEGGVRPYLQANVFFVEETATSRIDNVSTSVSESGAGFGLMGGVDIRLSRLLSLPVELNYLYAKPADVDVSSLGMSVGLTFNFTPLP